MSNWCACSAPHCTTTKTSAISLRVSTSIASCAVKVIVLSFIMCNVNVCNYMLYVVLCWILFFKIFSWSMLTGRGVWVYIFALVAMTSFHAQSNVHAFLKFFYLLKHNENKGFLCFTKCFFFPWDAGCFLGKPLSTDITASVLLPPQGPVHTESLYYTNTCCTSAGLFTICWKLHVQSGKFLIQMCHKYTYSFKYKSSKSVISKLFVLWLL